MKPSQIVVYRIPAIDAEQCAQAFLDAGAEAQAAILLGIDQELDRRFLVVKGQQVWKEVCQSIAEQLDGDGVAQVVLDRILELRSALVDILYGDEET